MSFDERLKQSRINKGFSQIYVSSITGIGNKTLSDYERGITKPDPEAIKLLAKLYGVSSDYLIGLTDEPNIVQSQITEDDFLVAFSGLSSDLTEEQKKQMLAIASSLVVANKVKK